MYFNELLQGIQEVSILSNTITENQEITAIERECGKVRAGCLYVCVKGSKEDGHRYAAQAISRGAAAVVVQRDLGFPNQLVVTDSALAYALLVQCFYGFPARQMDLLGVTGTNGKTSVTSLIRFILEKAGQKVGLIGTVAAEYAGTKIDSSLTTPDAAVLHGLFAQMVQAGCKVAVMEVSSHALAQKRVAGIGFRIGVFTNLTQDHLDYHQTMENYYQAKKELFAPKGRCGLAVINADDPYGKRLLTECAVDAITFSAKQTQADFAAQNIKYSAQGVTFDLVHDQITLKVHFSVPGLFSVYNALAAIAACFGYGLSLQTILEAVGEFTGVCGRSEVIQTGLPCTVLCDYAHTPDGLSNILRSIREYALGRVITVFGCGGDRDKTKRPLMARQAELYSDLCIVTDDNPRTEASAGIIADIVQGFSEKAAFLVLPNREKAIEYALTNAKKNDIVLLAGKGHESYQIIGTSKRAFDEHLIVKTTAQRILEQSTKIEEEK